MASSQTNKKLSKFIIENDVFISTNDEINASELQDCIVDLVQKGVLPPGTIFYMIGGIHHGITRDHKIIEGQTDFKLLQGFYYKLYSKLFELKIWKEMNYDFSLVPIACSEEYDHKSWQPTYKISKISKHELFKLARKLLTEEKPSLIIFASCFSFDSMIKDILYSRGVMASVSISYDKGIVTEGKLFSLDLDQQEIIKRYDEVNC